VTSELMERQPGWVRRIGWAVALWAGICGVALLEGMRPDPFLLAGLSAALSVVGWLTTDSIGLADPTGWQIADELTSHPRGIDPRVVTIGARIADSAVSASSRLLVHQLLMDLADERLMSLHGINRRLDPAGARTALGPELDDYLTSPDPGRAALRADRMSKLLNRIESL
jgi:hypothetical protein